MFNNNVIIFDTTLRDGEQCPGASMTLQQKISVAEALEELGVDVIEAGFAMASKGDFEAIEKISQVVKNSTICSLSRARENDIQVAFDAIKKANRKRIHTFISTSDLHIEYKLKSTRERVLEMIKSSVSFARNLTDDVEWSAEDATRTDFDYLCKCVEVAIASGATTINLPDTVGFSYPSEIKKMFENVVNRVPNIDKVILSTHCHNDLGMGTANSLSAVEGGARQIECTINGLGERAGNTALEEVVMSIKTRNDILKYTCNIKTENISKISKLVSKASGFLVQKNKAIVGKNAFAHESGIHQDGMLKNRQTYEIMTPESVGINKTDLVLGKHSGRSALKNKLQELGFKELTDEELNEIFEKFKALGDIKKEILDDDIFALMSSKINNNNSIIQLKDYSYTGSFKGDKNVSISLLKGEETKNGNVKSAGIVNSCFEAINKSLDIENIVLEEYNVVGITKGADSQAEATITVNYMGTSYKGSASDFDVVTASIKSYIYAVGKIVSNIKK